MNRQPFRKSSGSADVAIFIDEHAAPGGCGSLIALAKLIATGAPETQALAGPSHCRSALYLWRAARRDVQQWTREW